MSLLSSLAAFLFAHWLPCLLALAALELFAFCLYGADKRRARKGAWRIPEKTLLLAAFFGPIGAFLAMQVFRHKTKHKKFTITVPVFLLLRAFTLALLALSL